MDGPTPPGDRPQFRTHRLGVPGEPVRYRTRLVLEAVGEDWDGTLKPIDALTHNPPTEGPSDGN